MLTRSIPELVNSDFFKYSPFKALTNDQAVAIEQILETLFKDIENKENQPLVVQGNPGTGKTIVAVYLIKLLVDIQSLGSDAGLDEDSIYSDFFQEGFPAILANKNIGFVVPQQSLRKT
jgi:pantothenate kinase-related protein Tda10